jgi:putative peptidoglycan lipid II flippase
MGSLRTPQAVFFMEETKKEKTLARTAGAVSLATLISRILGLMREMVLAKYFNVFATDAFFAAFRIPNLLRDLFAEGALSAAFVPTFTDYWQNRGKGEAWKLANVLLNALTVVLSAVTLLILFGAKYLVYFLVSGYSRIPGKIELTIQLTRVMSPFLLTVALAAAVMGILNTRGRFFIPAVAPAFFNVASILAGIFLAPHMPRFGQLPIFAMAVGSLTGGILQLYVQIPSLYRCGYRYEALLIWNHPGLRRVMGLMLPAAFGLAATQINILIDNQLASYLGNGPVSWLNYAFRLMQLPIGIFGVAIATVHLATVSKRVATNDLVGVQTHLADAIKLAAFLNIPATLGLIFLRYPIVQLLYERGRFTHDYTIYTGDALLFYSLGLYAYSLVKIITPTFYALGDTRTPVRYAALVIAIKIAVNLLLIRKLGFIGLAFGTAIASILNTLLLLRALKKKLGGLGQHEVLKTLSKITVAALVMGLSAQAIHHWLAPIFDTTHLIGRVETLSISIFAALLILLATSYLLRIKEATEIVRLFTRGIIPK